MFREISQTVPPGSLSLMEEDRDLERFGFLHQPRDAFGLSDFEMHVVKGAEDMERWEKTRQDQSVYFLVKIQSEFNPTPRWEVASDLGDFTLFHLKRARV